MIARILILISIISYFYSQLQMAGTSIALIISLATAGLVGIYYAAQLKLNFYALLCALMGISFLGDLSNVMQWWSGSNMLSLLYIPTNLIFAGLFFWSGWKDYKKTGNHSIFVYAVSAILLLQIMVFFFYWGEPGDLQEQSQQNLSLVLLGAIGTIKLQEYDLSKGESKYLDLLLVAGVFSAIRMVMQYIV